MKNNEIKQIFMKVYNGQVNFMTNEVLEYGEAGAYLYELSCGDFLGKKIYGVTFLMKGTHSKTNLNEGGITLDQARNLINSFK